MFRQRNHEKTIPLLQFWTWRYALILLVTLVSLGLLAGMWIQVNDDQQRFSVLQARAEQLGDSYTRATNVQVKIVRQFQLQKGITVSSVATAVPAKAAMVTATMVPMEIARPIEKYDDFMQIFDTHDKEIATINSRSSMAVPMEVVKTSADPAVLAQGQSVREKIKVNDETWLRVGVPLSENDVITGALYLSAPLEENTVKMNQTYVMLTLIIVGIAFGGWIVIYLLSRKLTSPLRQLAGAAIQIAEGDYSPTLPMINDVKEDELRQLVASFDVMTKRLKQLEQMRTDLLAGVSHELRTPVTSIRGMVQAVQGGVVTGEKADEFLQTTLEEAKRMQKMVEDLLDFSSLEAGVIQGDRKELLASELIESAISPLRSLSAFASTQIKAEPTDDSLAVIGDSGQLKQILINLLTNSAAAGATEITFAASRAEDGVVIDVTDNGNGIRESEVPYIFERYYRGDSKRKKKHGLGLGLPLCRLLAHANGGELFLLRTSEQGTVFRLRLPSR
ncbi:sensor histidine kinase [Brevibacillus fluminis]|uniref:histidine kinase n=1 Tax=Brevibacillus fluminis TaxID=511487 RepID=A0A3M8DV64_9BACL|nr:HAMP domain-containing sensor histidine kinase [Brevibacillus fluminis]RNB91375.1 sensor histidine kinase [Brevibacillus fluminis]